MRRATISALLIAAGLAATAHAAEPVRLIEASGRVLVSRDGALSPAAAGTLQAGDRVIAADGSARIAWNDGCAATLQPNAMLTIAAASPCAGGPALVTNGSSSAQAADAKPITALQWGGIGLSVVAIVAGLAAAADDITLSN